MSLRLVIDMNLAPAWVDALRQCESALLTGALVVIEERKSRARMLPL